MNAAERGLSERMASARDTVEHVWEEHGAHLAPRMARAGRNSVDKRLARLRRRAFFIVQCSISAGIAWFISGTLLGHTQPFFAPVAALITLGQSFGHRLQRVFEVVVGVAIGVLVGDVFIHLFGAGYWQLAVIIAISMAAATLLGAGVLMTTQAGVQSAFVVMIIAPPGEAFSRWSDAVVGGLVALIAATITPASPLRRPRQHAAGIVSEIADVLTDAARAMRANDENLSERTLTRARASESSLSELQSLADDGLAVVRTSPFRRGHLPAVQAIADLHEPLDRAIRNIRVLVRRVNVAIRAGEVMPKAYADMVDDLAQVAHRMAADLQRRHLPEGVRGDLVELAERTTFVVSRPSLSSEVIRAQVRSTIVDLLQVTGLSLDEALSYIPSSYVLSEADEPVVEVPDPVGEPREPDEARHEPQAGATVVDPATGPLRRIDLPGDD